MKRTEALWKHPNGKWTFRLRRWECCDLEWELFMSLRYPGRELWDPICPKCGLTIGDAS